MLLDGAGIPGAQGICRHGVAWYSRALGTTLLARMADTGADPVTALGDSIDQVASLHRDTCDIANPSSPQATVAIMRLEVGRADYLVLADSFVVLVPVDAGAQVVTDPREVDARDECASRLHGLAPGTPEYERARVVAVDDLRARRNQPGGYCIAKDDPHAATEAVTGAAPLADLKDAALLSNGAARLVDPYRLADWPRLLELLQISGPDVLLRQIREAEQEAGAVGSLPGFQSPDDATAAYCDLTG